MRRIILLPLVLLTVMALAACTASQTGSSPQSSAVAPTPGASAAGGGDGGAACAAAESGATATVTVNIKDFAYSPEPAQAKVGDVVSWSNGDSAPHTATMDDGACDTGQIAPGATGLLTFTAPGTYAYHCTVHSNMKGSIVVS
jgi:plastocyanin